jgi:hypothetical protein
MAKLLCSFTSKLNGLNTIKIVFATNNESHEFECAYTDYESSYYGKSFTKDETSQLIEFLQKSLK